VSVASRERRVVIIGPGKLGCGYLAPLFLGAGWRPALAARTRAKARRIARAGAFGVRVTPGDESGEFACTAVPFGLEAFEAAIEEADFVLTAVGVENVAWLGPGLARALARRDPASPLDVCVVENADVAPVLERAVQRAARYANLTLPPVGFAGAIAYPVVACGDWDGEVTPTFVRDGVDRLLVDSTRLLNPLPDIPGVEGTSSYRARLQEKLFVFGAGHALCAYLGACCGYERLDQAAHDPLLRTVVRTCLAEARSALDCEYPALGDDGWESVDEAMHRYENEGLEDPIRRVARSPIRKLASTGPLVGAAKLVRAVFGRVPPAFTLGIASALLYRDPLDSQSRELDRMIRRRGARAVVRDVCGVEPDDPWGRAVVVAYERIRQGGARPRLAA
jgi:mannitol-1-phosphate 5-dehydrogenase